MRSWSAPRTPCYGTIQQALDAAGTDVTVKVAQGVYDERLVLQGARKITLEGGYNAAFASRTGRSVARGLTVRGGGSLVCDRLTFRSAP